MDYNASLSGQIVFRGAVGESKRTDYSQPERPDPWRYSLGIGVVHVPEGAVVEERILPVILGTKRAELSLNGGPQPLNRWDDETGRMCSIDGIYTTLEVPSPGGLAELLAHGGLYLRRSRFPGPEGTVSYIVAAIMRHGMDQLPERTMYRLEGTVARFGMVVPRPMPETFPVGSTPSQTLSMPIWEARDGLRGFYSSLHLEVMDECREYRALERMAVRDAAQEKRFGELQRSEARHIVGNRSRDSEFARFVELAHEMGEPIERPFDTYPTAAEMEEQRAGVDRIVRAVYAEREARYASPGMR